MILAKEFEGELWVKAADHHREVKRSIEVEREECAKVCEDHMEWGEISPTIAIAAGNYADLIRARGDK
jgi:hypothetical protein